MKSPGQATRRQAGPETKMKRKMTNWEEEEEEEKKEDDDDHEDDDDEDDGG